MTGSADVTLAGPSAIVSGGGELCPSQSATVNDATCEGSASGEARFTLLAQPSIVTGPADTSVMGGSAATLTVQASGDHLAFQWFEGNAGDMSKPVLTGPSSFITPALWSQTSYWVRVVSPCGAVASRAAAITVVPRRRPSRR